MKRYFVYLMIYSIGGFILERFINLIFLGYWWDNSVLVGPYQPLYGNGVLLTILFFEFVFPKLKTHFAVRHAVLIVVAIAATALSEAGTGYFFEWLTGIHLWDYGQTFTCNLEYICVLPTSLFGVLSYLVVVWIHPRLKRYMDSLPNWLVYSVFGIFIIDIIYTFITLPYL